MQYLCLVHVDASLIDAMTKAESEALTPDSVAYDQDLERTGHYVISHALREPETAKIVRVRGKQISATDGPYAETKEHLGGFILIEASSMEEAAKLAAGIPLAKYGSIEVRPTYDIDP